MTQLNYDVKYDVKLPIRTNVFLQMYVYVKRPGNAHLIIPVVCSFLPVGAARRLLASDRPLLDQNLDYHWAVTSGRCYMQSEI